MEVPCNKGSIILYCFLGFGDYEKTTGGVCVRALCRLIMQTIWDFQHINVSYKKK
jgi:hypothetical protein